MEMISSENSVIWAPVLLAPYLPWSRRTDLTLRELRDGLQRRWDHLSLAALLSAPITSCLGHTLPACPAAPESSKNPVTPPAQADLQTSTGLGHCCSWPLWETKPPHRGLSRTALVVVLGIKISFPPLSSHAFIPAQCTDKVWNYPTSQQIHGCTTPFSV